MMDYESLRAELLDNERYADGVKAQDYAALAALLNSQPLVENTEEQGSVPAPVELKTVMGLVPSDERVKVRAMAGFIDEVRRAVETNDRDYLAALLNDALTADAITLATAAKLQAMLAVTIPDQTWRAQVAGASRAAELGFVRVSAPDVQYALEML